MQNTNIKIDPHTKLGVNKNLEKTRESFGVVVETPSLAIVYAILAIVAGLVLPLLLIPLIKFTGYSEIVEEIAKALVVLFLILKLPSPEGEQAPYRASHKMQIFVGIAFGFLFGLSENIFYLNNIFALGDFSIFWQRFLWTVPMHIITVLVMVFAGLANRIFLIFGFVGAVILHALFNSLVVNMLI